MQAKKFANFTDIGQPHKTKLDFILSMEDVLLPTYT